MGEREGSTNNEVVERAREEWEGEVRGGLTSLMNFLVSSCRVNHSWNSKEGGRGPWKE